MSSINLSYYDVTRLDWKQDSNESGAIDQSGNWSPLGFAINRAALGIGENREQHYGNSQFLTVDKRAKKWGLYDIEYKLVKYSSSPAWDWWDLIRYGFYGAATGAPATRPSSVFLGAKLNYSTPNYWIFSGCKHNQVQLKGSMVSGGLSCNIRGMSKYVRLDTNNYIQGTAAALADPTKTPIIPASDVTITINGNDETNNIQEWTLTMLREIEGRGRSSTVSGSSSQIAVAGDNFREIVPNTFAARMECVIDPYGTTSTQLLNYLNDTALSTFEIRIPNETNGKAIQFTASKLHDAGQEHREGQSPSTISLNIEGSTFNVNTL